MMNVSTVKMKDIKFDDSLFVPMPTGSMVDEMLSSQGGLMKGCNFAFVGDPGVGKSTVLLDILSDLQKKGSSVMFISGEMNSIDMYGYVKRFPKFGNLPILFMGDHVLMDPLQVLQQALKKGTDVVLVDSMAEVVNSVADYHKCSVKQAETMLLNLFESHNLGNNMNKTYTTFLIIQQVTKQGNFAGSNRFKHMTTGMFHMNYSGEDLRVLSFSKNRRGAKKLKLVFDLDKGGNVTWIDPASLEQV